MTKFLSVLAVLFGFTMVAIDTEAARVGGGRSAGRQSSSAQSAPAQKTTPAQATPTPAAPQPSGMSKWMGPLAGLAAGIGLASLLGSLGGGGLGAAMGGLMMVVLLLGVGFVIYRLIKSRSQPQGNNSPLGYAGAGNTGTSAPVPQAQPAQFTGNAAAPGSLAATVGGAPVASNAAPISAMQLSTSMALNAPRWSRPSTPTK